MMHRNGMMSLSVILAGAAAAFASPAAVELDAKTAQVVLRSGEKTLVLSAKCPLFVFEHASAGVDAMPVAIRGQIGGNLPVEITYAPLPLGPQATLDVRLMLQWSADENVLRKWAWYRVNGMDSAGLLCEVVLETLDGDGRAVPPVIPTSQPVTAPSTQPMKDVPNSLPVFYGGYFAGIEFPVASTRAEKDVTTLAYRPGRTCKLGEWQQARKAVYGVASVGQEKRAFHRYIAAHRPPPRGLHINYNSWWTSPIPYTEADILKLMAVLDEKLYRPYGVAFDTVCIDLGWSNVQSVWEIDPKLFPDGFAKLQQAAGKMKSHLGLWLSPSNYYAGMAGVPSNDWAAAQGYETMLVAPPAWMNTPAQRLMCLAGPRYAAGLADRLSEVASHYGVRQFKFDGYRFECPETNHGHAPGIYSADAVAEGVISVIDTIRRSAPDVWIEATCFWWNPSPWWLFHVNSVLGTHGDDAPLGRVPCPIYRESYTTARDFFNLQGAANSPVPAIAQEVLGIIHQSDEPLMNDAVVSILRGHGFQSAYINPAYMTEARWKQFADLIAWARRNAEILADTQPLLPKSWQNGNVPKFTGEPPMPLEPYGYEHWNKESGLVVLRNPWITSQTYELKLNEIAVGAAVSIYPQVRLYGRDLRGGDTLKVPLAPYETVVLQIGAGQNTDGIPEVAKCIGRSLQISQGTQSFKKVQFDNTPTGGAYGPDWTSLIGDMTSAVQVTMEADVHVDAPEAEYLVLLEGAQTVTTPISHVWIDGKETSTTVSSSDAAWNASVEAKCDHWLFLRAPLSKGKHNVRIELLTSDDSVRCSSWVWAYRTSTADKPASHPNLLPPPERISLDSATLISPVTLKAAANETVRLACPIERIEGVFLDTIEPASATQGWGTLQRNKSVTGKPLVIGGKKYLRGLGTHSPSKVVYALNGQYKRFQSWVGADDAAKPSVTFEVLVDGQKRWESGLMTVSTPAKHVDLDLAGAKTLELVVGDGGNNYMADHADWADARLLR